MQPTLGRIVIYNTTELEQRRISEHPHNTPREKSPAMIVAVNDDDTVNLKVFIDGWGEIHAKNVSNGDEPGEWDWPGVITLVGSPEDLDKEDYEEDDDEDYDAMLDLTNALFKQPTANIEHKMNEQLAKKFEAAMENPPVPPTEEEETKEVETTTTEVDETKAAIEELEKQPETETPKAAKATKTPKAVK